MLFDLNKEKTRCFISGPAGCLDAVIDHPLIHFDKDGNEGVACDNSAQGLAIVCHPHTLYGGTMNHKVVTTLSRTFQKLNLDVLRFNFRGAGKSEGEFDNGRGEQDDLLAVVEAMAQSGRYSHFVLAGFSFGAYVASAVVNNSALIFSQGPQLKRLVLVGAPAGKWDMPLVPKQTIIIHGENDEIISLQNVLEWGNKIQSSVFIIENANHFFDCKLHLLRERILSLW